MALILALQANPKDETRLKLDDEVRNINLRLLGAGSNDVRIHSFGAVRKDDIHQLLQKYSPSIIHFSGHGREQGLIFEDSTGHASYIHDDFLINALKIHNSNLKCVVINCCNSKQLADKIAKIIPCAIGTTSVISDEAAKYFSGDFYGCLANGISIERSFLSAQNAVAGIGNGEEHFYCLSKGRTINAKSIYLYQRPEILARFDLDKNGNPIATKHRTKKIYDITVYIRNCSESILSTVYQYNHQSFGEDQFNEVLVSDSEYFEASISVFGDIQIRATLWSKDEAEGIHTRLKYALKNHYSKSKKIPTSIKSAIEQIKKY